MTRETVLDRFMEVFDFVANAVSAVLLAADPTKLSLVLVGAFSVVGLTFRILQQKAENKEWQSFYERSVNDKETVLKQLDEVMDLIENMDKGWQNSK